MFFDRSIMDCYGYSRLEQLPLSDTLLSACRKLLYGKRVFLFPPWQSIFTNDVERKQDFSQAVATYNQMVDTYRKFGYQMIEVPKTSVSNRAEFILATLKE